MSEFLKKLNGQFGMYFWKNHCESGYVFQSRFKSTLIQDDLYVKIAIRYLLQNPVRAGIVKCFDEYEWSSGKDYFRGHSSSIVESGFVEGLFNGNAKFVRFMGMDSIQELPIIKTRYGEFLGQKDFEETAVTKSDRRERYFGDGMKRIDDNLFEPVEKVIWEFENKIGKKVEDFDVSTHRGKRLRGELLVLLKDLSGLTYSEIGKIQPFCSLKFTSFPKLYKDTWKRRQKKSNKVLH